ncbi:23S rRNA pseudouridine(2605) synthase RluB [Halospina sp. K52047b]|uniref:23S rRNA pseudouridine(2605) synthase RluB n=1 Tax=Halospina sp. K52047b TaxID=2614160 RepID=UPI00124A963F|nr:23S rRNA pseudouridine(2605) synthase RluB [Halospina sp. K52047b]KAA8981883.1 23S rRNA pseudouridine(2605) synthase RluB [Halospina sp. K52047b]
MSDSGHTPNETGERLQKLLARAGLGSRRAIEGWISQGRVQINGEVAQLGARVTAQDEVLVDGRSVDLGAAASPTRRVIVYNKPEGEVTTRDDPEGRPTVFDRLPRLTGERWIAVGRLDISTSGLLLFTTDGELANRLMHPSWQVDREYAVRIFGQVDDDMAERLVNGVTLEDGEARFTDLVYWGGTGHNHWYYVAIMEGRNREVRRLWESQGVQVSRLKRVRHGPIFLPSRLSAGRWEELEQADVDTLSDSVGLDRVPVKSPTPTEKHRLRRLKRKRPSRPDDRRSAKPAEKGRGGTKGRQGKGRRSRG